MTTTQAATAVRQPDGDDQLANVFPDERHLSAVAKVSPDTLLTPTEKSRARKAIAAFLLECEHDRNLIDYSQARPFDETVDPDKGFHGDCSALPSQSFRHVVGDTGIYLEDPNGREYDGYGFTGTLLQTNHAHQVPLDRVFMVGDIAIFGPFWRTKHAIQCRKQGRVRDAIWTSHGSIAGPLPELLTYRGDLLCVVRPLSLL